jgi:hypothetical protein
MSGADSLPGCFAINKPLPPNKCETCRYREDCKRFVPKAKLEPILSKILEIEAKLR